MYFVELFAYINSSGDFEAWDDLVTEECNFCSGTRGVAAEIYDDGGWIINGPARVTDVASSLSQDERA